MALQDLTPQLRTRLNRMERAVGWFVFLAAAAMLFGFGYFIYKTSQRKGWFIPRAPYFTFTDTATGLKVGDPVVLMGREVGQITRIDTMDPWSQFNVYVEFVVREPYNGYLWQGPRGSRTRVSSGSLLTGNRVLEVTKGFDGYPAYSFHPRRELTLGQARTESRPERWQFAAEYFDATGTNRVVKILETLTSTNLNRLAELGVKMISVFETNEVRKVPTVVWDDMTGIYTNFIPAGSSAIDPKGNLYWLISDETPAITERVEAIVEQVRRALPGVLQLTNAVADTLAQGTLLLSNANHTVAEAQPAISNLTFLTAQLKSPGSLGDWMLGSTGRLHAEAVLGNASLAISNANLAIAHADTNLTQVLENLAASLDEAAGLTANLRAQVEANTNIVSSLSKMIVDADDLMQGLKKHWLLRSAFKKKAATPAK